MESLFAAFRMTESMRVKLPVMTFQGRIMYSRSATGVERAAAVLLKKIDAMKSAMDKVIIGFDIEYRPTFQRGLVSFAFALCLMVFCGWLSSALVLCLDQIYISAIVC